MEKGLMKKEEPISYVAGFATRNPSDFTPKAWYAEMDEQARAERKWRRRHYFLEALAYIGFFVGVFLMLKSL